MAGFFLDAKSKSSSNKRKSSGKSSGSNKKSNNNRPGKQQTKRNEEIESSDEESIVSNDDDKRAEQEVEENSSDEETAAEKRLRLAKDYIDQLEVEDAAEIEDDVGGVQRDAIAHRLQRDALEDAGRLEKFIADTIEPDHENIKRLLGHRLSVTCCVVSTDSQFIFSSSKDGAVYKWSLCTCEMLGKIDGKSKKSKAKEKGHVGHVLALALSTDFMFLATSGHDQLINIWNPVTLDWLHTFKGHRGAVSGLAFQQKQHQLFSASDDRTVKVWNCDQMAYVETLFGHEDGVRGITSLNRARVVTCGGRDRSVRLWKIPEESQLVFQSSQGSSFDCVAMLNEDYFITGGDDGSLSIFFTRKKKPITLRTNAHNAPTEGSDAKSYGEGWITALTCIPYTDMVASGSSDGVIRIWRCVKSFHAILKVHEISVKGFVNSLAFTADGEYLIAGIGQEHRLGRWWSLKEANNSICVVPLKKLHTVVVDDKPGDSDR